MQQNPQAKEKDKKVRLFELAKELNLASKDLVAYAQELGFSGLKNQLNTLEPEQVDALKDRAKKGPKSGSAPAHTPANPPKSVIPTVAPARVQTIKAPPKPPPPKSGITARPSPVPTEFPTTVAEIAPEVEEAPARPIEPEPPVVVVEAETSPEPVPATPRNVIPTVTGGGMMNLNTKRPGAPPTKPAAPTSPPPAPSVPPTPPRPAVTDHTPPPPAKPQGSGVIPPRTPQSTSGGTLPPVTPPGGQRPTFLNRAPQVPPPRLGPPQPSARTGPGGPLTGGGGGGGRPPIHGGPAQPPRQGPPGSAPGTRPPAPPARGGPPKAGQAMRLTPEMIERLRNASAKGQKISPTDLLRPQGAPGQPAGPGRPGDAPRPAGPGGRSFGPGGPSRADEPEDDEKKKGPGGGVIGRDSRHRGRQSTGRSGASGARVDRGSIILGPGGQVDMIEQQSGSRRGPRAALLRKHMRGKAEPIKIEGRIEIAIPVTVRNLSETIGMKVGELTKRLLKETNQLYGINSVLDFDAAALIAAEKNVELVAKKQETAEDKLLEEYRKLLEDVDVEKLQPRPPIVTIMGHVDHGKTSLLDKIRQEYGVESDVVSTEAGGITQVIRAWSVKRDVVLEKDGQEVQEERRITFLDTPGHEAFTKMRARGANVTDIVVIVVAATDGVMPQTQEAISHAKAADVKIIVAINKIDMPNANIAKTRQQLYGEGLIPDDMGGDVQFVETSAITGVGITDLLDTIILVAEVENWKADPDRRAAGTCLEAYMSADEGVMATVLIQQGTLKKGDIVLCGSAYGRVRAMYNDMGNPTKQAGPSTPVRITGLDHVPNADDPFYVVDELTRAQEIAEAREIKDREAALNKFSAPKDLDSLSAAKTKAKISELKIILKAEARGSVEAIRKELEKLVHEEIRTRVLLAGIGAITESDVILALTSPEDTLVIGFNVTADDAALKLAEARGVSLREYQIIYNLVDDVKAALEGRLKPIEEVVHLGRAVIRDTFKISKVGTIAGCYVTSGTIERSARVRVIREGVVVYPPGEKIVGLDSLKRFKDDAKEVREGFECGMKLSGFDDVKVGDVIEAFKIEKRMRTL